MKKSPDDGSAHTQQGKRQSASEPGETSRRPLSLKIEPLVITDETAVKIDLSFQFDSEALGPERTKLFFEGIGHAIAALIEPEEQQAVLDEFEAARRKVAALEKGEGQNGPAASSTDPNKKAGVR